MKKLCTGVYLYTINSLKAEGLRTDRFVYANLQEGADQLFHEEEMDASVEGWQATLLGVELG
jgi:hypothetical protein